MAEAGIVTLLFTDLVGSTELLDRLGDLGAERVRRTHFGLLRDALTERGGEEVKNLGDGLMAVFPSASDAVSCAVAMQAAVAAYNRTAADGTCMDVRVGLHVGEPIRDEGDFFGTPVVVAKRLCDRATGGQIVASGLVRELVASRGEHEFAPLGQLDLKGLSEPVVAFEVLWADVLAGPSLELPASLLAGEATAFVSRDMDLGRLVEAWSEARKGAGRLAVVSGEPGVGKTRLCAELGRVAHLDGAMVLHGRCYEEGVVPYQPFVEALGPFVDSCTVEELRAAVPTGLSELARLIPRLAVSFPTIEPLRPEPEAERYRLFESVGALLDFAAGSVGVVAVLDDLHWADKPTLVLLQHVLRRSSSNAVQVVGTYRDTELEPSHPLADMLATLRRDDAVMRVALHGLDESGVAALLGAWAGHDPPPEFVHAVFAETEGNPFFVNEVVQHLAETGAIYQRDGKWVTDLSIDQLGIPEGVREVVGRRLARLGDDATPVLNAAAIAGREFDAAIVADASGVDEGTTLDLLDRAIAGGLVHELPGRVGGYAFSHALVQETLRHRVGTARRAYLHRRIGEAIESRFATQLDAHVAELAFHFGEAAAGDTTLKAVDYACRAGTRAQRLLAYEEAASMFERALQGLELSGRADPARRSAILQQLGTALGWALQLPPAWAAFDEARELARDVGDAELIAGAAVEYADFPDFTAERTAVAVARLEEALTVLPPGDSFLRARALVLTGFSLWNDARQADRRVAVLYEGLAMARRIDAPRLQVDAIGFLNQTAEPAQVAETLALQHEALTLAVDARDTEYEVWTRSGLVNLYVSLGRLHDAREQLARADTIVAAADGTLFAASNTRNGHIMFELLAGRFDQAERLAEEAALGGFDPQGITYSAAILRIREEQGRLAEIEPRIRELTEITQAPAFRAALGVMDLKLDRRGDAREQLDLLSAIDLTAQARSPNWTITAGTLAELVRAFDATELAAAMLPLLEPWTGRAIIVVGVACDGSIDRHLALLHATLGDTHAAAVLFEAALTMDRDRLESPPLTARVQVDYAAMLLERDAPGDHQHATELLADAETTAHQFGMLALARQTSDLGQKD